jgi:hypothetical protein
MESCQPIKRLKDKKKKKKKKEEEDIYSVSLHFISDLPTSVLRLPVLMFLLHVVNYLDRQYFVFFGPCIFV